MRAVPQPVGPQSSSSHHVAPDFTALASPEPGTRVAARFLSFANGVRLPYHRADIPVLCGAPATSFRPPVLEWTVDVDVVNRDISYPSSCRPEPLRAPHRADFRYRRPRDRNRSHPRTGSTWSTCDIHLPCRPPMTIQFRHLRVSSSPTCVPLIASAGRLSSHQRRSSLNAYLPRRVSCLGRVHQRRASRVGCRAPRDRSSARPQVCFHEASSFVR